MTKKLPLAIHTYTNKPWSFEECVENYARAGISGISIWRETIGDRDPKSCARVLRNAGLTPVSLVRGGFFTAREKQERERSIAQNRRWLQTAAALGCPLLVLVCGATPGQTVATNLEQITSAILALATDALNLGVKLAIEPLHPKYAGDRSAVTSMACANALCDTINHPSVGIALDVYHVWWEHDLESQISRAATSQRLLAYHICDFKSGFDHPLLDRGLMGEGCIPLRDIDRMILASGFNGHREVEIFSRTWWAENQHDYLEKILSTHRKIYENPHTR